MVQAIVGKVYPVVKRPMLIILIPSGGQNDESYAALPEVQIQSYNIISQVKWDIRFLSKGNMIFHSVAEGKKGLLATIWRAASQGAADLRLYHLFGRPLIWLRAWECKLYEIQEYSYTPSPHWVADPLKVKSTVKLRYTFAQAWPYSSTSTHLPSSSAALRTNRSPAHARVKL